MEVMFEHIFKHMRTRNLINVMFVSKNVNLHVKRILQNRLLKLKGSYKIGRY